MKRSMSSVFLALKAAETTSSKRRSNLVRIAMMSCILAAVLCGALLSGCAMNAEEDSSPILPKTGAEVYAVTYKPANSSLYTVVFQDSQTAINEYGAIYGTPALVNLGTSGQLTIASVLNNTTITNNLERVIFLETSLIPTSLTSCFSRLTKLKEVDLSLLDTGAVKTMDSMFFGCSSLQNFTFNGLDTSAVTNFGNMFSGCTSLKTVDMSMIDTRSATNMVAMFNGCSNLTEVNMSNLNLSKVTSVGQLFNSCTKLERVDFENTTFGSGVATSSVFSSCINLSRVSLSPSAATTLASALPAKQWVSSDGNTCTTAQMISMAAAGQDIVVHTSSSRWDIVPSSISIASTLYYTGKPQTPEVTVTVDGVQLKPNSDYTVAYSNNVNAGEGLVTVTGLGPYNNIVKKSFTINPRSIESSWISPQGDSLGSYTYDGTAKTPDVSVSCPGSGGSQAVTLTKDVDYTLTYADNIEPGTGTVAVAGIGNYAGTVTKSFQVTEIPLQNSWVSAPAGSTYNGTAQEPTVIVTANGKTLVAGTDYTLAYGNNENAGTGTVTVTGIGYYVGSIERTFTISRKAVQKSWIQAVAAQAYTGSALEPALTVKDETKTLTEGTDYTVAYSANTSAGTATATVTGVGNYSGTASATFTISPKAVQPSWIQAVAAQAYTGSALEPALTVKDGTKTLVSGTDYTVAYSSNTNAGTATATITGVGNYSGTASATFTISPKAVQPSWIQAVAAQAYTGSALEPALTVKDGTKTLTAGTDYTVAYADNTSAGTATATVAGVGNYSGTATATFTISPKSIQQSWIQPIAPQAFTGSAIEPSVIVKNGEKTLEAGTDYTVAYSNNVGVGTATATITGAGNYSGTASATFSISMLPLQDSWVSVPDGATYDGTAKEPAVTVTANGKALAAGVDYTAVYSNNVNAGTGTVTVTGAGNYGGSIVRTFPIAPRPVEDSWVRIVEHVTHSGDTNEPEVAVEVGDTKLVRGTDYTVHYEDNDHVGEARVIVSGLGNYTGTVSRTFYILTPPAPTPPGPSGDDRPVIVVDPDPKDDPQKNDDPSSNDEPDKSDEGNASEPKTDEPGGFDNQKTEEPNVEKPVQNDPNANDPSSTNPETPAPGTKEPRMIEKPNSFITIDPDGNAGQGNGGNGSTDAGTGADGGNTSSGDNNRNNGSSASGGNGSGGVNPSNGGSATSGGSAPVEGSQGSPTAGDQSASDSNAADGNSPNTKAQSAANGKDSAASGKGATSAGDTTRSSAGTAESGTSDTDGTDTATTGTSLGDSGQAGSGDAVVVKGTAVESTRNDGADNGPGIPAVAGALVAVAALSAAPLIIRAFRRRPF